MNHPLARPSGTLSPSEGERDGVRGGSWWSKKNPVTFSTFLPLLRMYDKHHSRANCPERCGPRRCQHHRRLPRVRPNRSALPESHLLDRLQRHRQSEPKRRPGAGNLHRRVEATRRTPRIKQTARLALRYRAQPDRKSTRLNSSHLVISPAVFCLKKKKKSIIYKKISDNTEVTTSVKSN